MPVKAFRDVPEFLASLDEPRRTQVELLRSLLLGAEPGLVEQIKWNAPSYVWKGEDRVTFNVQNKENVVKLVLHQGATRTENKKASPVMADETGLVAWQSDIRGLISFTGIDEIRARQTTVVSLITRWLAVEPV